ncbi:MAG: ATP-dependent RecD-like DNA helicase, partial [Clostridia bacterium]|nr:ATP-dependent RecD-like DNA helicase [Clostridia bacterium]
KYQMKGEWSKNPKFGLQFEVESYEEIIIPNRDSIVSYLTSGQIKGIGPVIAQRIYDTFGDKTLEILDKEPKRLLEIHGISEGKLNLLLYCDKIID